MEAGHIFFAKHGRVCIFRLIGDVRHTASGSYATSTSLNAFIDKMLAEHDFENIVIDLCETTYIDSTNLGLLARMAVFMKQNQQCRPTIVSSNPRVTQLLRGMGFDSVFVILDQIDDLEPALECLPECAGEAHDTARMVLDAHQTLASLSEKNRDTFKDVIRILEQQVT